MSTLLDDDRPAAGRLDHMGVLRLSGADAVGFLQGQVSNDTRRLAAGTPLLAAYSSPQGRVLSVLHLIPHSSGVLALLPRDLVQPTLERLRRYVLRAKVRLEDQSGQFAVFGLHAAGGTAAAIAEAARLPLPQAPGCLEQDGIAVAWVGATAQRCWVVGRAEDLAGRGFGADAAAGARAEHDWRLADIRAGLPQIYTATCEQFVAQMLNLDLLDGISFTKGCFTGQEIIARTQHLGRIKRRMFRLSLPAASWQVGQAVRLRDGRSGRLIEVASAGPAVEGLAVLGLEPASGAAADAALDGGATNGDLVDARELPLPYSLAGP